jgi:hypothetical protein
MMSIETRHRLSAMRSHFELACLAGMLIVIGDLGWLAHDILVNGFSILYGFVGLCLIVGLIATGIIVYKHNSKVMQYMNRTLLESKLDRLHRKLKHK